MGRRGDGSPAVAWRSAIVPVSARGAATASGQLIPAQPQPTATGQAWHKAVDAMVDWYHANSGPLWTVEGPAGSGKTKLADELAHRLNASGVPCGWARPGMGAFAITAAARNGQRALIIVDDAETRADLGELLRALANKGK